MWCASYLIICPVFIARQNFGEAEAVRGKIRKVLLLDLYAGAEALFM